MKIVKPLRVIAWSAFALTLVCILIGYLFWRLPNRYSMLYLSPILAGTAVLIFLSSFFLTRYIYKRYVIKPITDIYKFITRLRNLNERNFGWNENHQVEKAINFILLEWSSQSREAMDHYKQVESYRREFLSNVSHELKTPIFSIQGYIHTLIDGGIEDEDINMLYLNKAGKSIDRLISIVDDLESISRLEAGELIIEQRTFDIRDLTKDVIESLELQAREKNVKIFINETLEKPCYVYADKEKIRQVLVNLLVNSIKYGKHDGQTEVGFRDQGDLVYISVVDNGIGVESHQLPRLFERFYRVDKSRSREQGGTGLGLAIVKHILEAHQQSIVAESEIGIGTTFSFTLKKSK